MLLMARMKLKHHFLLIMMLIMIISGHYISFRGTYRVMMIMSMIVMIRHSLFYYLLPVLMNLIWFLNHINFLILNFIIFHVHKCIIHHTIVFLYFINIIYIFNIYRCYFIYFICNTTPISCMSINI